MKHTFIRFEYSCWFIEVFIDEHNKIWFGIDSVDQAIGSFFAAQTRRMDGIEIKFFATDWLAVEAIGEYDLYRMLNHSSLQSHDLFQSWVCNTVRSAVEERISEAAAVKSNSMSIQDAMALFACLIDVAKACGISKTQAVNNADKEVRKLTHDAIKPMEMLGIVFNERNETCK